MEAVIKALCISEKRGTAKIARKELKHALGILTEVDGECGR